MTEFERYVVEEHIEDIDDGLISRRELIRRITLITGSAASSVALLSAMGCGAEPSGSSTPTPTSRGTSTQQDFATPPAQPTQDGVTVKENDPRITVTALSVKGTDGASLISYYARPTGVSAGGILVIHENRGLLPHIKDVVRRGGPPRVPRVSVHPPSPGRGAGQTHGPAPVPPAPFPRAAGGQGSRRQPAPRAPLP